jgi:hypothetical protein
MKPALRATGLGGIVTAAAAAGRPALAGLGVVLLVVAVVLCWVVTNRDRTVNTVAIIAAIRGRAARIPAGTAGRPPRTRPGGTGRSGGRRSTLLALTSEPRPTTSTTPSLAPSKPSPASTPS